MHTAIQRKCPTRIEVRAPLKTRVGAGALLLICRQATEESWQK